MSEIEKSGAMDSRSQRWEYGKTLRDQVPRGSISRTKDNGLFPT
jgi:hypothetical protein